MKLIITIKQSIKQFTGIGRYQFSYFQDGIQYKFPYFVRYGQFERVASDFCKKFANGFVGFKTFHCAEDVVLHHRECYVCNLCGEVYRLASAEAKRTLAVAIGDLRCPAPAIQAVSLKETQCCICRQQTVPLSLVSPFAEIKTNGRAGKVDINHAVCTFESCIVLAESKIMKFPDNLFGSKIPVLSLVSCFAQFNHTQQITFDMSTGYQTDKVRIGKPTVHQQIVKANASLNGILHHLDGFVGLLHRVLFDSLVHFLTCMTLVISAVAFFISEPLFAVGVFAFLTMQRKIEQHLTHSIGQEQGKAFVTKYALLLDVREHLADEFTLLSALRSICIIYNQTDRLVMRHGAAMDFLQQLEIHCVKQLAPLDIAIIHKTIKHVLFTNEHFAQ